MHVRRQEQVHVHTEVVAVQLTRQHVVDVLRRAGLPEMPTTARRDLPDPVDSEQAAAWAVICFRGERIDISRSRCLQLEQ